MAEHPVSGEFGHYRFRDAFFMAAGLAGAGVQANRNGQPVG